MKKKGWGTIFTAKQNWEATFYRTKKKKIVMYVMYVIPPISNRILDFFWELLYWHIKHLLIFHLVNNLNICSLTVVNKCYILTYVVTQKLNFHPKKKLKNMIRFANGGDTPWTSDFWTILYKNIHCLIGKKFQMCSLSLVAELVS